MNLFKARCKAAQSRRQLAVTSACLSADFSDRSEIWEGEKSLFKVDDKEALSP